MEKNRVAIDDFCAIKKLGSLTLSPDGRKAAFTVTSSSLSENRYTTDIWVYDPDRKIPLFRLTSGEDGKSPVFLDDNTVLFPADRKHEKKSGLPTSAFYTISLNGGEAEELLRFPFTAVSPVLLKDGRWLCGGTRSILHPEPWEMEEAERKELITGLEEEKDYSVFDELPFWQNGKGIVNKVRTGLILCDTVNERYELLTDRHFDMHGFTVNSALDIAVCWGCLYDTLNTQKSKMYILDLCSMKVTEAELRDEYAVDQAFFIGDDIFFAATDGSRYGTSENDSIYRLERDGSFSLLCRPDVTFGAVGSDIAGSGSHWNCEDGMCFIQTSGYHSVYRKLLSDGSMITLADDIGIISAAVGDDDIIFIGMEKDCPQELYIKNNGVVRKLSSFNGEYMSSHATACTEHFTFTDSDSVEIDGWIMYPPDFDLEKTYPAILTVHGGPRSVYGEGFFHEFQYWAGLGYIVFFCNPRGSAGKGDAFADILGEKFGVLDYNDVMEFTDAVLERVPQIDPARIAMTGGSYGGFMANWIIGHTDRFAAVASCRSISNYISKCLTTDIGYYHNLSQIGADPWTGAEQMWRHSPLAYADKAVTPTLFIQSDEDYRCWMGDSIQMLQALLMKGVPARMCMFHGENHELSRSGKPKHRARRLKEITDWFDTYLDRA